jgi:hypothetical protein
VVGLPGPQHPAYRSVVKLADALWAHAGPQRVNPVNAVQAASTTASSSSSKRPQRSTGTVSHPPPLVHSIWVNFQPAVNSNTILGQQWVRLYGPEYVWQEFGGCPVAVAAGGFVQANYGAMQLALAEIQAAVAAVQPVNDGSTVDSQPCVDPAAQQGDAASGAGSSSSSGSSSSVSGPGVSPGQHQAASGQRSSTGAIASSSSSALPSVVELYAGSGAIGISLAGEAQQQGERGACVAGAYSCHGREREAEGRAGREQG